MLGGASGVPAYHRAHDEPSARDRLPVASAGQGTPPTSNALRELPYGEHEERSRRSSTSDGHYTTEPNDR